MKLNKIKFYIRLLLNKTTGERILNEIILRWFIPLCLKYIIRVKIDSQNTTSICWSFI